MRNPEKFGIVMVIIVGLFLYAPVLFGQSVTLMTTQKFSQYSANSIHNGGGAPVKGYSNISGITITSQARLKSYNNVSGIAAGAESHSAFGSYSGNQSNSFRNATSSLHHSWVSIRQFGALGDSASDNAAFRAAIQYLDTKGGGEIRFPSLVTTNTYYPDSHPTFYNMSATVVVGSAPICFTGTIPTALNLNELSTGISLVWQGSAKPMFDLYSSYGTRFKDITIDGEHLATECVHAEAWKAGGMDNVLLRNARNYCLNLMAENGGTGGNNVMWNKFNHVYLYSNRTSCTPLNMDANPRDWSCDTTHNTFSDIDISYQGDYAMKLLAGDNNTFFRYRAFRSAGTGNGIYFGDLALDNYFYHVQTDGGVEVAPLNTGVLPAVVRGANELYDYDMENSQPAPHLEAGAKLVWMSNGAPGYSGDAPIWNLVNPIRGGIPATFGNVTTSNCYSWFAGINGQANHFLDSYIGVSISPNYASNLLLRRTQSPIFGHFSSTTNGLAIGGLGFYGSNDSGFTNGALIRALQVGSEGTYTPTAITFMTSDGTTTYSEHMRISPTGNVGIGTPNPSASALVDMSSISQGLRIPRMTLQQMSSIVSPAPGLMVEDDTTYGLHIYNGSQWVRH